MRNNGPLVAGGVVVSMLFVGVAVFFVLRYQAPSKPVVGAHEAPVVKTPPVGRKPGRAARWACLPRDGARLAWQVDNRNRYVLDPTAVLGGAPGTVQRGVRRTRGVLRADVHAGKGGGRVMVMALQDAAVTENGKLARTGAWRDMAAPIAVEVGRNCGIKRLGFGRELAAATRNEWRLLLGLLNVKRGPNPDMWQVRQRDATGDYVAHYGVAGGSDGAMIRRRKRYTRVNGPANGPGLRATIEASMVRIRAHADGGIAMWRGEETVRLDVPGGRRFARNRTTLDVAALDGEWDALAEPTDVAWSEPGTLEVTGADPHFDLPPGPKPTSLDEAMTQMAALDAEGKLRLALGVMVPWLRSNPSDAAALLDAIKAGRLSSSAHATAFLALELAATPQSRAVLVQALLDDDLAGIERSRAAAALQDVPNPDAAVVEGVLKGLEATSKDVVHDAMLAVGALAGRHDVPIEARNKLQKTLATAVGSIGDGSAESDDVAAILGAVGNTLDAAWEPKISPLVDANEAGTRAAAINTLHRLDVHLSGSKTLGKLASDTTPRVRSALVPHIDAVQPDIALLDATMKQLGDGSMPLDTRKALARLLIRLARRFPAAKKALDGLIEKERDVDVLRVLGTPL